MCSFSVLILFFVWAEIYLRARVSNKLARRAYLVACICWGILLVFITESLSLLEQLNYHGVLSAWGIVFIILLPGSLTSLKSFKKQLLSEGPLTNLKVPLMPFMLGTAITLLMLMLLGLGLISSPNTWDGMTYHLPRVMHWIQNGSVNHYPTHILRQLYQPPWSEYLMLHLQLLVGRDALASLPQWLGMFGSAVGVSLIARLFSLKLRGQVTAVGFAITTPMSILQATSTQNDHVLSFWIISLICFIVEEIKDPSRKNVHLVAACAGLAILTKGTAYIYIIPPLFWYVLAISKPIPTCAFKAICLIALTILMINSGHYLRNFKVFNNIIGGHGTNYFNESFHPKIITTNIIRNVALHVQVFSPKQVDKLNISLRNIFNKLDTPWDDAKSTWPGAGFTFQLLSTSEDWSGNPIHLLMILIAVSIPLLNFHTKSMPDKLEIKYFCVLASMFLLFCALLKWQPWHSRLHLPLFLLFSPLFSFIMIKYQKFCNGELAIVALLLSTIPWLSINPMKPLLGANSIFNVSSVEKTFFQDLRRPGLH